ncbi:MAG: MaoC family dehydratase N-terminal domain-containing protein [Coriobacteriales bacterium]|jgi:acyl dehydratase|nr:MaoC family dehydratase N-terminal domain-containing protein [Coriobacteriales bacterium]
MYLEEFTVGQEFPIPPVAVTKEQIISFAKEYDPLPLHLDEKYAKTTRFGGLIASGVMSFMLVWAELVRSCDPLGVELIAGKSNHMSWAKPTYPGDVLTGVATVVRIEPRNPYNGILELSLTAHNQDGESVVAGGAEIVMERKSSE